MNFSITRHSALSSAFDFALAAAMSARGTAHYSKKLFERVLKFIRMAYKTPGVYIKEIPKLPPSVGQAETAIPVFIGYTEKARKDSENDLLNKAVRIKSMVDYELLFGGAYPESFTVNISETAGVYTLTGVSMDSEVIYRMYYGLRHYFDNGGGPCYIISISRYEETPEIDSVLLEDGLDILINEDEPTLIVFPDAAAIDTASAAIDFYGVYKKALAQCAKIKDRFTIIDVHGGDMDFQIPGGTDVINDATVGLRALIGTNDLKYGAAYYPWLKSNYVPNYDETEVDVVGGPVGMKMRTEFEVGETIDPVVSLYHFNNGLYNSAKAEIAKKKVVMPPSSAMAGVYAKVDATRGVWKAPANVSLNQVIEPVVAIGQSGKDDLNIHPTGKSVNAIRSFPGKGILVWGARTLAGNDNEWRYVPVRRFFNMVEKSVKRASEQFVFEPNDANTWTKVRAMIENFLLLQWRAGALQGAKPEQAFYVQVGLGTTMTAIDISEGRMIVEIGMAVVKPAEFIILRFSQKMPVA
jgi:uncharacterized protein